MEPRLEHLPLDVFGLLDPLVRAALAGRPRPPALAPLVLPAQVRDAPRRAERLDADERAGLVRDWERRLSAFKPHVAVLDSVRRLRHEGSALVLVRLRADLAGGPVRNLWRALHAARVARSLESAWGTPVVPALWNDADDPSADPGLSWLNDRFEWRGLRLAGLAGRRLEPARVILEEGLHRPAGLRASIEQELPPIGKGAGAPRWGVERAAVLDGLLPRAGESLGSACTRSWLELTGPLGLLVFETGWVRERLARALAAVAGADLAPDDEESAAHPFAYRHEGRREGSPRRLLRAAGGAFCYDGEPGSRTGAELAAEILQEPHAWSPGELTRAVCAALALPVALQVADATELAQRCAARWAEAPFGDVAPPLALALSCTIVDGACRKSLARLGLETADILRARGLELDGPGTPDVLHQLRELAARSRAELLALRPALSELDRGLGQQLRRVGADVSESIEKLCSRAERLHANRHGKRRRHARRIGRTLTPRGGPQEDVLSTAQTVLRYGRGWLEALVRDIEPFPSEHLLVHLD